MSIPAAPISQVHAHHVLAPELGKQSADSSLLPLCCRYMLIMFHGYLHELVGGLIGIGPRVRTDMFIHHVATMTLISSAYLLNLSRMGIMWQALFDISNPLLHAAKMMNTLKFPQVCVCVCARGWEHVFCL
eukprot:scaffold113711_cov18-Tisochrysis_lutea.AAC.1